MFKNLYGPRGIYEHTKWYKFMQTVRDNLKLEQVFVENKAGSGKIKINCSCTKTRPKAYNQHFKTVLQCSGVAKMSTLGLC